MRRVPAPLLALLAVAFLVGTAWSLVTPAFQTPDEAAHVAYAQSLAERHSLPGDEGRSVSSTEQATAAALMNADQTAGILDTRPEWSRAAADRWAATEAGLPTAAREDGGGPNPAAPNPPLSYLADAGAYTVAGGGFFTRLWAMRMTSVLAFLLTITGVWLLCGEVFRRDRVLQVAAAGATALAPMLGFLAGAVMPDPLVIALSTLALWLGARVVRRGVGARDALALGVVVGLAGVTKSASLVLVPPALLALAVGAWRARARTGDTRAAALAVAAWAAGIAATLGVWVITARIIGRAAAAQVSTAAGGSTAFNPREFLSYLWQFYLPKLPFMSEYQRPNPTKPVFEYWVKGTWGNFGWLEIHFADPVYFVLAGVMVTVALLGFIALVRLRDRVDPWLLAFFTVAALTILAGLHWTDYRQIRGGALGFAQGRYLLPLAGLAALLVALALRGLRPRARAVGAAVVLAGMFTLTLFSFGLVLDRFYA